MNRTFLAPSRSSKIGAAITDIKYNECIDWPSAKWLKVKMRSSVVIGARKSCRQCIPNVPEIFSKRTKCSSVAAAAAKSHFHAL